MPAFIYTARDSSGQSVSGVLVGNSVNDVSRMLRADGKFPISVRLEDDTPADTPAIASSGIKVSRADVIQLATQLAIMVETGVTITEALDCIAQQTEKPKLKTLIEDLAKHVHDGGDFSGALSRHPRSFPRLFIALIKASEKSGMLGRLLSRAAGYLRDESDTIKRVRGALIYPGIMLSFAVTTTIFLLAFVLPRFAGIYAGKEAALPLPTRILMTASDFIIGNWILLLIGLIVTVTGTTLYFRSPPGSRVWHYIQLHFPLLGGMFRKVYLARGMRMLGTLGAAGVNLSDSVVMTRDMCGNTYFRDMWEDVSNQIHAGRQLSEPLFNQPLLVPRSVAQMLLSGEKSGKLSTVLEQVATYSEQEMRDKIADLTRYIEPAMIVIMGAIIGGITLALLLPVFTISRVVAQ